jgi:aldehyde:ferredoxin oxidoreductase
MGAVAGGFGSNEAGMGSGYGWSGKILRVNVSDRTTAEVPTAVFSGSFLGGVGIGYKIAWDELPAGCSAFSAQNKLIFSTGPLSGTLAPGSGWRSSGFRRRATPTKLLPALGSGGIGAPN